MSQQHGGFDEHGLGGRPTLPTGEPVLARWFVLVFAALIVAGLVAVVWAVLSFGRDEVPVAARRPAGDLEVTHPRGQAVLAETRDTEPGPGCAGGVTLIGDEGGRATGRRALEALCFLIDEAGDDSEVEAGLLAWQQEGAVLRVAIFELTGVDASTRVEGRNLVIEINAKFQFDDAAEVAPLIAHELVHLARGWPLEVVDAAGELAAMQAQADGCARIAPRGEPPRGCLDAAELLGLDDPLAALREAGYP